MKGRYVGLTGLTLLTVIGCAPSMDDLATYTAEVRARTPVSIEPYPEFSRVRPFNYNASEFSSPFIRSQDNTFNQVNEQQPDCLQPQIHAVKHPLEKYGLDALRMSGTLLMDEQLWVLISTNDGRVHKAAVGTPIGLYYGTISAISPQSITVTQLLPDGTGCWQKKDTLLTRARAAGEK